MYFSKSPCAFLCMFPKAREYCSCSGVANFVYFSIYRCNSDESAHVDFVDFNAMLGMMSAIYMDNTVSIVGMIPNDVMYLDFTAARLPSKPLLQLSNFERVCLYGVNELTVSEIVINNCTEVDIYLISLYETDSLLSIMLQGNVESLSVSAPRLNHPCVLKLSISEDTTPHQLDLRGFSDIYLHAPAMPNSSGGEAIVFLLNSTLLLSHHTREEYCRGCLKVCHIYIDNSSLRAFEFVSVRPSTLVVAKRLQAHRSIVLKASLVKCVSGTTVFCLSVFNHSFDLKPQFVDFDVLVLILFTSMESHVVLVFVNC